MNIKNLPFNILNNLNLVITNTDNRITFISDSYAKLMGYDPAEVINKKPGIFKFKQPMNEHWERLNKMLLWENLDSHHCWKGILKNITKNGEIVYFNSEIYKDFDIDGNHIGYHAIQTHITDAITKTHKFIFDNELMKTLISSDNELMVICLCKSNNNPKNRIIEISNDVLKIIGLEKNYIYDNNISFADILSPHSKYYNNLDLLVDDVEHNTEIIVELKEFSTGKILSYKVGITPFYIQGNLTRIFKLSDITTELEYSNQLKDIIKSKNDFLANLSHEIKTPLNAVNGFLTLLQLREEEKDKLDYINIIQDSTQHILDLTNDVIDFASMDNNKLEIVPREFTPKDLQSTIEIFYAKSMEKNIDFTTYISPQLPDVMLQDIVRIKQIINNLISNALKFVDIGGSIDIDLHYHKENIYFTIIDNGIGMTKEQMKKIFDPYTQASTHTKLTYGGTGLGLSVVKRIVELMGGSISIDSEEQTGSTFSVIIPTKSIKTKKFEGKLIINNISIFAPSCNHTKLNIIKKYLMHFSTANISTIDTLDNIDQGCIIINLQDVSDINILKKLSENNKIILIKKLNEMVHEFDKSPNIVEINLPILGSKLFDALNLLINNTSTNKKNKTTLDIHIKGKLLIADDMESNRTLIKELLSKYEVELDIVNNGKEAIDKFNKSISGNKSEYDMVILDMNMPIVNGSRAAQRIREFEKQFDIIRTPIIVLTANRFNTHDDERLSNMDEYIPKPINLKHLLSTIVKYTSNIKFDNTDDNVNRIKIIKKIRDKFMNGKKVSSLITEDTKNKFKNDEIKLLTKLSDYNLNNKREFNSTYNNLMKLIRRNY